MIILGPQAALARGVNWLLALAGAEPVSLLFSPFAVLVCLVYVHLPFMVLPLYANLEKHNQALLDAAQTWRPEQAGSGSGGSPFRCHCRAFMPAPRWCSYRRSARRDSRHLEPNDSLIGNLMEGGDSWRPGTGPSAACSRSC